MAVKLGGDLSGAKARNFAENSDINVTPFVDIMLVLLIIFMIAAPLATVNIKVDLPPSSATPTPTPPTLTIVSIQNTGQVFVTNDEATFASLGERVNEHTGGDTEERIFVRADKEVAYGQVMRVMNILQDNGYYKVALVAEDVD